MARKTKPITIDLEGRDKGKRFILVEMPASQGERWAFRMMEAAMKSGVEIPENVLRGGMAGLMVIGMRAVLGASYALTGPLLDEMFNSCVNFVADDAGKILHGPGVDGITSVLKTLVESDIEEVMTRLYLREELIELHTGFSVAAYMRMALLRGQAAVDTETSSDTRTSSLSAEPSSQAGSQQ